MAHPVTPFTQNRLIEHLQKTFEHLPDGRKGNGTYQKYSIADAAMSAFSVFFMQSPSFLDHQKAMQKQRDQNNAHSLFGVHQIPSDNQIRNLLDSVSPEHLKPLYWEIFNGLNQMGKLTEFETLDGHLLVALDGVEYFSSQTIHCDCCSSKLLRNGKTHYYHTAVTPVIVSPDQSEVIPLAPEFVRPQDGCEKQDYELAASKRWINQEGNLLPRHTILLGDDLYCHQPFCEQVLKQGWSFLLVCKPDSHQTVYEWVNELEPLGKIQHLEQQRWTGKQRLTDHYRWVSEIPLRNTDDALLVNWCELITTNEKGEVIYRNAFATNHTVHQDNIIAVVRAGRARWKIENENNNTLSTKGYHFKHNYGHGKNHLASLLASLIILAYCFHTVLGWFDEAYRLIRQHLPSRKTFFDDLRALTRYMIFKNWQSLMEFMLQGLEIPLPQRGAT